MLVPKPLMKDTYSCISQMFRIHDGTCYGCVIRRLAGIITGRKDVPYRFDILKNNNSRNENLLSLLRFSHDIIFNFDKMPSFSKENIEGHNKFNLFSRFAIDNFLALHKYVERGSKLSKSLGNFYSMGKKDFDKEDFEKREEEIKNIKNKPNFNKNI